MVFGGQFLKKDFLIVSGVVFKKTQFEYKNVSRYPKNRALPKMVFRFFVGERTERGTDLCKD